MSSQPMRDPKTDHLLTPENSAFLVIDYQPIQVNSINSMPHADLVRNIILLTKLIRGYNIPTILSTVNVVNRGNGDTIPMLKEHLSDLHSYDRTSINAWEDTDFRKAVEATGRKKIIIAALWTEACLTFPALDMIPLGYEIYAPVDSVGGTSLAAHEAGLRRVEQAGAKLTSIPQIGCELQRDWNRKDTVSVMFDTFSEAGIFLEF